MLNPMNFVPRFLKQKAFIGTITLAKTITFFKEQSVKMLKEQLLQQITDNMQKNIS